MNIALFLLIIFYLQGYDKNNLNNIVLPQNINKNVLLTPPNINWKSKFSQRYYGTFNRFNNKLALSFAFTKNLLKGQFYYRFNNNIEKGNIISTGSNPFGYWFRWNDKYGQGSLQLRDYPDGSLKGIIYIDDDTMLGRKLGHFIGYRDK